MILDCIEFVLEFGINDEFQKYVKIVHFLAFRGLKILHVITILIIASL